MLQSVFTNVRERLEKDGNIATPPESEEEESEESDNEEEDDEDTRDCEFFAMCSE